MKTFRALAAGAAIVLSLILGIAGIAAAGSWCPPTTTTTTTSTTTTTVPPTTTTTTAPSEVKPFVNLLASPSCGGVVDVTVNVGPGENLVGSDGQATVTFLGPPFPSPGDLVVSPSSSLSATVVYPASDAGQTELIEGILDIVGFEGTSALEASVTLPGACPTPTTVPPAPCSEAGIPGVTGTYNGSCPPPAPPTSSPPAMLTATPPTPIAEVPAAQLAATGANIDALAASGFGFLLFGTALVLIARRRAQKV